MMSRWRGALVTTALLMGVIAFASVRPGVPPVTERAPPQPSASPSASSAPAAAIGPFYTYHSATAGFDVRLPRGWTADDRTTLVNRRTVRLLVIGNQGTSLPAPSGNQTPLPGQPPDWTQLASEQIVLELLELAGPGGPSVDAAATESSFPLDWSNARQMADGQGSVATALSLSFQHMLRPLTLTARIGTSAPASDVADIADIVVSLRPEPIPTGGEYRGWRVIGPLMSFQIGAVMHFDSSVERAYGFYFVRGARTMFAFLDSAYLFMGAMKPCPIRYEAASRTFVCDATSERWSRVGKQLTGAGSFGLAYHTMFVKDGLVFIGGGAGGGGRNTYDETAEFSEQSAPPVMTGALTKAEILDRYSRLTSTTPTVRAAAKLVSSDAATISQVVRGSFIPTDTRTVWVVAFAGDVKLPGSATSHGRWSVFIADPRTGGVITAACCGEGDWPPGFDQLPDLARN
jgi:hypothetical protein